MIKHPTFSFFFAGDAGYSQDFADIGQRLGPFDLAAIPIGAYAPRWFMRIMHVNPAEAVKVHQDVRARQSLGIHWGTFANLTDEALDEPPRVLADALAASGFPTQDFFVLKHGRRGGSHHADIEGLWAEPYATFHSSSGRKIGGRSCGRPWSSRNFLSA